MMDGFFFEVLRSLQTWTRKASKDENTLRNQQIINKYITDFCALYHFQLVTISRIASNLEAYIARQMLTAHINNGEMRTGTHFRMCINAFFDVRSLHSTLWRRTTTTVDKQLARTYISEISSFKTILTSAESYNALKSRVDKIRALDQEYLEAPANERNVSVTHLHYPFLALLFHPQASPWTLIVSPPSLSGPRPKTFMIFRSSLALLTSTIASSTGSHASHHPSRFYFGRANGSTGSAKPNPHLTNSNIASLPRTSSNTSILIYRFACTPTPRDLRFLTS